MNGEPAGFAGHWLRIDDTVRVVDRRMRAATVARCACGWESKAERIPALAVEAGSMHSTEATARDRRARGEIRH